MLRLGHTRFHLILSVALGALGCDGTEVLPHAGGPGQQSQALRPQATARQMNLSSTLGRLSPLATQEVAAVQSRVPADDLIVYSSTRSASQVLGTGAGDLLPTSCATSLSGTPPDYEAAARCFVAAHPGLLLHGPESTRGVGAPELVLAGDEAGGSAQPERFLRFEQHHSGFRVEGRSIVFVFSSGRLVTVAGRYAGNASLQPPVVNSVLLRQAAASHPGAPLEPGGHLYNPDTGELEAAYFEGDVREHRFNAADGSYRSSRPRSRALEVTKDINVYQFTAPTYLGYSGTTSLVPSHVTCKESSGVCDVTGTGTCQYVPRQDLLYFADRVKAVHVTYNGGSEDAIWETDPCGSASPFTQLPWTSQYYLEHYAASVRRNLDEAANMLNHSHSFFWVYPRLTWDLELNINGYPDPKAGGYSEHDRKINIWQDPWPGGRAYARNLGVIAHEFGHYAHDMYGYAGDLAVTEGWADQFALRLVIHKRFVTAEWAGVDFLTEINAQRRYRVVRSLIQGEYIYDQLPSVGDAAWIYYPGYQCGIPGGDYACGAPIGATYWTLAFDTCRINYLNCVNSTDIVRYNGGYQNAAWKLANSTYAYAIAAMSGVGDVAEFMALVSSRYAQFRAQGYLDSADEARVNSVLAAHCLGPLSLCDANLHKLPGSPLPSSTTEKDTLYAEAESGQTWYSAGVVSSPNLASGDSYVSFGSDGMLKLSFYITQAGTYRVHLVAKPLDAYHDEVNVYDPGAGAWKNIGPMFPYLVWNWHEESGGGADVTLAAGWQDVWLSAYPANMSGLWLDAVWLEEQ